MASSRQEAYTKLFLLVFVVALYSCESNSQHGFQRCRSITTTNRKNETVSLLDDFRQHSCVPCRLDFVETRTSPALPLSAASSAHVVILLSSHETFETIMVLTSGLLTQGVRVTLLASVPVESALFALLQHVPCPIQSTAQLLFSYRHYNLQDDISNHQGPCSLQDDTLDCAMRTAAPLVRAIINVFPRIHRQNDPFVLVLDAANVAGLLVAEALLIPSVSILIESSQHHDNVWNQALGRRSRRFLSWRTRLLNLVRDPWQCLSRTTSFVAFNQLRATILGLHRIRTLDQIWQQAPGTILVRASNDDDDQWNEHMLPNVVTYSGVFLPPCTPCDGTLSQLPESKLPTVVSTAAFSNEQSGRTSLRRLLQGYTVAKESMRQFMQCETSMIDEEPNCWTGPNNFNVVLMGPSHDIVLPSFVTYAKSAFLDVLSMHPSAIAIVSMCDTNNKWTQKLGPPVLCLDTEWSSDEIALQLLQSIRRHKLNVNNTHKDGMKTVITTIKKLARIKARNGHMWRNGVDMGRDVEEHLQLNSSNADETERSMSILVFLAWFILGFALVYVTLKNWLLEVMSMANLRARRHRVNQRQHWASAIVQELFLRLPELDRLRVFWSAWVHEMLLQLQESTPDCKGENGQSVSNSTNGTNHNSNPRKNKKLSKKKS